MKKGSANELPQEYVFSNILKYDVILIYWVDKLIFLVNEMGFPAGLWRKILDLDLLV